MKREIPMLITVIAGLGYLLFFFIPHTPFNLIGEMFQNWLIVISAFAILLGVGSLIKVHGDRISRRTEGWLYSVILLLGLFITAILGIVYGLEGDATSTIVKTKGGEATVKLITDRPGVANLNIVSEGVASISDKIVFAVPLNDNLKVSTSASPSFITADGASSSNIVAVVTDGSKPVEGALVKFSILPEDGGRLSSKMAVTDLSGQAKVVLYSTEKQSSIKLLSTLTTSSGKTINAEELTVSFVSPGSYELSAEVGKDNIPIGKEGTTIKAVLKGPKSDVNPEIVFSTDLGMFSNGNQVIVVPVKEGGIAEATLNSISKAGVAHITVTAGGAKQIASEIHFFPSSDVKLEVISKEKLKDGIPPDGFSKIPITANVMSGNMPVEGASVTFKVLEGNGNLSKETVTTDVTGKGDTDFISARAKSGDKVLIEASVVDFEGKTISSGNEKNLSLVYGKEKPYFLDIKSDQNIVEAINGKTNLKVKMTDVQGKPAPAGTGVILKTTLGSFDNVEKEITLNLDSSGEGTVNFIASNKIGKARIKVTSQDAYDGSIQVEIGVPNNASFKFIPLKESNIPADCISTLSIKGKVTVGDHVLEDAPVNFSLGEGNKGTISTASNEDNGSGEIALALTSGNEIGQVKIKGKLKTIDGTTISDELTVSYIAPGSMKSLIPPDTTEDVTPGKRKEVLVKISVKDKDGKPIENGKSVTFNTTLGFFPGTSFDYIFRYFYTPMGSTMFSLLAFFIASAAFRAFRAQSKEATMLLVAAFFVMLGRVPLGEYIWVGFPKIADWIMNYPGTAGQRAIMIGAALGVVSTSIKILIGIDKSYLGGD